VSLAASCYAAEDSTQTGQNGLAAMLSGTHVLPPGESTNKHAISQVLLQSHHRHQNLHGAAQPVLSSALQYNSVIVDSGN